MTINDLFAGAIEMLVRIAWAFERTFSLVGEGRLGELVLSDLAIVVVIGGFGLVVVFAVLSAVYWSLADALLAKVTRHEDPSDDD